MEVATHIPQVALALALIVALVVGLGFVIRRLNHGSLRQGGDIKIVASTFLGPKERVLLLEVQDRRILVGLNPNCIQALGEFAADAPFARALDEVRSA